MSREPLSRTAGAARRAARRWVAGVVRRLPGFQGAFFHGSITEMGEGDAFPPDSDVDVGVVVAGDEARPELGKRLYDGFLVEGAQLAPERLATPEQVLGDYRLAPSFRSDGVIEDPTGRLGRLQRAVGPRFAERRFVLARVEDARRNCERYVGLLDPVLPLHTQALCWLFAEGALAHVVLAAGLRNPTVRRRYAAAREVLAAAGLPEVHERLLAMLGSASMRPDEVRVHLARMSDAFDVAAAVARSVFPFRSDVSALARPIAIGGSLRMIEAGEHREAAFWIAVSHARALEVLETDAPGRAPGFEPGLGALLEALGVPTLEAMRRRADEIEAFLPELLAIAAGLAPEA